MPTKPPATDEPAPEAEASAPESAEPSPEAETPLPRWARACLVPAEGGGVPSRYYAVARREIWCEPRVGEVAAGVFRGLVTDFRGRPVAGAEVVVEGAGDQVIARGQSDAGGVFELRPSPDEPPRSVVVTAPGMSRHAYAISRWGGVYLARLVRPLTPSLIEEVLRAEDEVERLWSLLEVVAPRSFSESTDEVLFPRLGALRPHLRALIDGGDFDEPEDRTFSPADRALRLLALWHDEADRELVDRWIEASRYARRPARPVTGSTIDELCRDFADLHFEREGVETRTFHACSEPIIDETERHALVTFNVRYAHWGYTIILILRRESEEWRLAFQHEGERYHLRP